MIDIFKKDNTRLITINEFEYSGDFMGERFVSFSCSSPYPIDFEIGCYCVYRGERFELNYIPSMMKQSRIGEYGAAFVYDGVKFNSLADELVRIAFLDYVKLGNDLHYTALDNFSFFASTVAELCDRIQVNLDRVYGNGKWVINVVSEGTEHDKNISVNNYTCWQALSLINSEFNLHFTIKNRTITVGAAGLKVGGNLRYGKGKGFLTLEKKSDDNQAVVTRLYAYGSEKNLPQNYYKRVIDGMPNNYAINHLMLPSFSLENQHPCIESKNIEELGVREAVVYFDGSNGLEDIYPTIEGLKDASGNPLNVVEIGDDVTDDGIYPKKDAEGKDITEVPNFHITIANIGFDINEYLSGETATIAFKSGMCAGREFQIIECKQNEDGTYSLECQRGNDSSLNLYFPYSGYNIRPNDRFVLLNIQMPPVYVQEAAERLQKAAEKYLEKVDHVRYSYAPKIDNIYVQREYDESANKEDSIYYKLYEGCVIDFSDSDLDISNSDGSIFIDKVNIKEGTAAIPEIDITLSEEKSVGIIERIMNKISDIENNVPDVDIDLSPYKTYAQTLALLGLTKIEGGFIMTNLINMRDIDGSTKSGISGIVEHSALGGGIAAWFGGDMIDHEAEPNASHYAKSLFRFDGSGYLAGGYITFTGNTIRVGALNEKGELENGFEIDSYGNVTWKTKDLKVESKNVKIVDAETGDEFELSKYISVSNGVATFGNGINGVLEIQDQVRLTWNGGILTKAVNWN